MSPCSDEGVGAVSLIRYARKPRLDHLDHLLHECADRPLRLRNSSLRYYLPVLKAPEKLVPAAGPVRGPAEGDDAAPDIQRGLCGRTSPPLGFGDRLP